MKVGLMRRPFLSTTAIFILGSCLTMGSQAQIFECKDAQGRKIMASRCPLGSTIVKEVDVTPVQNGLGKKPDEQKTTQKPAQQNLWAKDIEFKERQKQKEEQAALERDKQRRDEEKCYQNQKRLNTLNNGLPLTTGENAQGEPILMSEEQRSEEIKKVKEKLVGCKAE
jgi:hypothetical protein